MKKYIIFNQNDWKGMQVDLTVGKKYDVSCGHIVDDVDMPRLLSCWVGETNTESVWDRARRESLRQFNEQIRKEERRKIERLMDAHYLGLSAQCEYEKALENAVIALRRMRPTPVVIGCNDLRFKRYIKGDWVYTEAKIGYLLDEKINAFRCKFHEFPTHITIHYNDFRKLMEEFNDGSIWVLDRNKYIEYKGMKLIRSYDQPEGEFLVIRKVS
jgi:hypothetical protein